jgi:hypothetical protein
MVYDANLTGIGYFTENGHTEKFDRTEKGDLAYAYWGSHTHEDAIKALLDIPREEILEIIPLDSDWILSDLYPNPKPVEQISPSKPEEMKEAPAPPEGGGTP